MLNKVPAAIDALLAGVGNGLMLAEPMEMRSDWFSMLLTVRVIEPLPRATVSGVASEAPAIRVGTLTELFIAAMVVVAITLEGLAAT